MEGKKPKRKNKSEVEGCRLERKEPRKNEKCSKRRDVKYGLGWKAERRVGGKEGNDTPEIASLSKERRKSGREVRAEEVKYA